MLRLFRSLGVSAGARKRIEEIWDALKVKAKTLTKDGKNRKARICEKVIVKAVTTSLQLNLYAAVLPILKSYVVLFQTSSPMVHKLADEQEKLYSFSLAMSSRRK